MKNKPELILYIILNIIISAATMLFVMWLWDRANPRPSIVMDEDRKTSSLSTPAVKSTDFDDPTQDFVTDNFDMAILTIVAPGNLDLEYVEIRNQGEGAVNVSGWQLRDEDEHVFTFPTLILNADGAVKILSQKGVDTVIELYWQSDTPIWESGETARLLDENGSVVATYSIP